MQTFVSPLHYSLTSDNQLARVAAEQFTSSTSKLIGAQIFTSRVEMEDPGYMDVFARAMVPVSGMDGMMPGGGGVGGMVGSFPGVKISGASSGRL